MAGWLSNAVQLVSVHPWQTWLLRADAPAPAQKGPQKRARVQSPAKRKERWTHHSATFCSLGKHYGTLQASFVEFFFIKGVLSLSIVLIYLMFCMVGQHVAGAGGDQRDLELELCSIAHRSCEPFICWGPVGGSCLIQEGC